METIKNILIDGFNGMSLSAIPFFLFQILAAAFMGWILQIILQKKGFKDAKNGIHIAYLTALVSALVKFMLPFSVLGAAVILLLFRNQKHGLATAIYVAIGVLCGIGSVFPTFFALILFIILLIFIPLESSNDEAK